jgi:flagellin
MNALLSTVKSLALHALNTGVVDQKQRDADQAELSNIISSVDRIAQQTRFAGQVLLNGAFSAVANAARFQVGEQAGDKVTLQISGMNRTTLSFTASARTVNGAVSATSRTLTRVSKAISSVTNLRGKLGAFQANTLQTGLNSLRTTHENLTAAESVIRDVDFAAESATYTKNSILVQSATAMLAQANQLPQNVLKLLG